MRIAALIVTYNRIDKLKHTLDCYSQQTAPIDNIIVVDNCSTDGTYEFLECWKTKNEAFEKNVIHTNENLGGSGGYYLGQKFAMGLLIDWLFHADDDAYPDFHLIEQFKFFLSTQNYEDISAVCTSVLDMSGGIIYEHRSNIEITHSGIIRVDSKDIDYSKDYFCIDLLSYVGAFIKVSALKKVGLVNKKYFIYFDDTEHSLRLKKSGKIICVPKLKIVHDSTPAKSDVNQITWNEYYLLRNQRHIICKYYPSLAIKLFRKALGTIIRPQSDPYKKMVQAAYRDAYLGRLGKHKTYIPGWSITKN